MDEAYLVALRAFAELLRQLEADAMLIGGLACSLAGYPRMTQDIDATVDGAGTSPEQVLATAGAHGFEPRLANAVVFAREYHVLLLRHAATDTPCDITFAFTPFEQAALARRHVVRHADLELPVPAIEDLLVYKAVANRPQDRQDLAALLRRHADHADLDAVRAWVAAFSAALEAPEMLAELDRLVALASRAEPDSAPR
jgi:hypothetical protein